MQNRGLVKFFAILFALVSIYQLSFTLWHTILKKMPRPLRKEIQKK
jgi:SecD/SecF fusion protein